MPKADLSHPCHRILLAWPRLELDGELRALAERGLAGLVLPGEACAEIEACRAFAKELQELAPGEPLLLAADDEFGQPWLPPEVELFDPALLGFDYEEGEGLEIQLQALALGNALAARGLNFFRGPRLDLAQPGEKGNQLCFGGDPGLVAAVGSAWVESLQAAGVIAAANAFPGRGALAGKIGAEDILRCDAAPFLAAAGRGLEVFELAAGAYPAAFGAKEAALNEDLVEWLREDIGFRGVIASPPLDQLGEDLPALARQAADAGCNLLFLRRPARLDEVLKALAPTSALERKLSARHANRIRKLKVDWLAD